LQVDFCPILSFVFANLFVGILEIFLHGIKALEVSFPTKKESQQLEFIKAFKSVIYASLSRFGSNLPGLDF